MNYDPVLPRSGFVSPAWLRRYLSISNSTLYAWHASGVLPKMIQIGPRARRFRVEDVRAYEERLKQGESSTGVQL